MAIKTEITKEGKINVLKEGRIIISGYKNENKFECIVINIKNDTFFNLNLKGTIEDIIQMDGNFIIARIWEEIYLLEKKEKNF